MTVVSMLTSNAKGFAKAVNRFAMKDKRFAEELVFNHGIRGQITPKALKGITKDMFDASGSLTNAGKKQINDLISTYKLPQNATWEDALQALRKYKDSLPEIKLHKLDIVKLKSVNFEELQKISKEQMKEWIKQMTSR